MSRSFNQNRQSYEVSGKGFKKTLKSKFRAKEREILEKFKGAPSYFDEIMKDNAYDDSDEYEK